MSHTGKGKGKDQQYDATGKGKGKDQQYDAFMKWVGEVGGLQNAQAPNCERDPTYLYVPPSSIHKI